MAQREGPHPVRLTDADRVFDATLEFADVMLAALVEDLAQKMTCSEAEAVARVYRSVGRDADAGSIIDAHAVSDTEEDDEHHDIYLQINDDDIAGDEAGSDG